MRAAGEQRAVGLGARGARLLALPAAGPHAAVGALAAERGMAKMVRTVAMPTVTRRRRRTRRGRRRGGERAGRQRRRRSESPRCRC